MTSRPLGLDRRKLLLNPLAHRSQKIPRFAFEPYDMNEDKTSLALWIWWLKKGTPEGTAVLTDISELPNDPNPEAAGIALYDPVRRQAIHSLEHLHLRTRAPIQLFLAITIILELQWLLQRITAMSGSAEREKPDDNNHK
ncbi:hypothetical protein ASPBRDRAFT_192807 [Aspergillus brasiliensis CBS 101740]|uniref:Uncharacterized protein n=1 Tax=Aspergillus brasiliensis (strain CBS 101740 / IMI 381727 / IBT 21946) TaxID=767769 RepID=A0A1L9UYB9_ASPBC|nr:hypothetical protein ASPBRDRAFT_192807 [Aspergillus brasiliensis CBS 101740]